MTFLVFMCFFISKNFKHILLLLMSYRGIDIRCIIWYISSHLDDVRECYFITFVMIPLFVDVDETHKNVIYFRSFIFIIFSSSFQHRIFLFPIFGQTTYLDSGLFKCFRANNNDTLSTTFIWIWKFACRYVDNTSEKSSERHGNMNNGLKLYEFWFILYIAHDILSLIADGKLHFIFYFYLITFVIII